MTQSAAPLFTDIHPGPSDGAAHWATTSDGLRVRIATWNKDAPRGTVFIFPGRTEYIEKYAFAAQELADRGFASMAIDWRGQGIADRLLDDVRIGHVLDFADFQTDLAEMVKSAQQQNLPEPYFLIGHSMGGCIGLRALHEGLPVKAAAFTGPMWGIRIAAHLRPVAWGLGRLLPALGQGHRLPPGTTLDSYVLSDPFEDNKLTQDRGMWDMMVAQVTVHPELRLGGPSMIWLREALTETLALSHLPAPDLPCVTFQGTNERIVHTGRIHQRMESWAKGSLIMVDGGEHEVLMEAPAVRGPIFDTIAETFIAAT